MACIIVRIYNSEDHVVQSPCIIQRVEYIGHRWQWHKSNSGLQTVENQHFYCCSARNIRQNLFDAATHSFKIIEEI